MNKRLITISPALLLSYTGARFEQLQAWQMATMPSCIIGGVKGRTMPSLHTALRLEIDTARTNKQDLVGIKLDKAKCFDRLIPDFTAALFLAFGLPQFFVGLFHRIYSGLRRHLAYKGWISPTSTTAPNGVVQGCSQSLIPAISVRAFVDDAYLWCHLQNIAILSRAVQVTRLWDELNGQKLNDGKSSIWGTSRSARKILVNTFQGMKLVHALDALGTRIYTSDRDDFQFSSQTLNQVCSAIEAIGALPVPVRTRAHLIGAKAIPKITYGSHISRTPKASLQKIQNAVAKALWHGRPNIRSKHLVLTFFGQPHRIDPFIAMAVNCLIDISRFCFETPSAIPMLQALVANRSAPKHSLAASFQKACETLGLDVDETLAISFHGSKPLPLGLVPPKTLRSFLKHLAIQAQYHAVQHGKRKDICKPSGLLDFSLSTEFLKHPTFQTAHFPSAISHFESVLVGCTLTKDRLFASGWAEDSKCRFCGKVKETLAHIVFQCQTYHAWTSRPVLHEFGANFPLLGIFEHPIALAKHRIRQTKAQETQVAEFRPDLPLQEFWTDGSLLWPKHFWVATAAFAVIDAAGHVVMSGPVQSLVLSSYVPELFLQHVNLRFTSTQTTRRLLITVYR